MCGTLLFANNSNSYFNCRGEHKMQLRRGTGSGSEEDPTHSGEYNTIIVKSSIVFMSAMKRHIRSPV